MGNDKGNGSRDRDLIPLGEDNKDRATAVVRAAVNLVPWAGPFLGELITEFVPKQRMDRIENFLRHLSEEVDKLTDAQKDVLRSSPEHIDLIEHGLRSAARSRTDERRARLAKLVAEGLSKDQQYAIETERLVDLFSQLDDDEVILLVYYVQINRTTFDEFAKQHEYLLEPLHATHLDDAPIRRRAALREAAQIKLERLGLVRPTMRGRTSGVRGNMDQMVQDETEKAITELGRTLLHSVGLLSDDEFGAKF